MRTSRFYTHRFLWNTSVTLRDQIKTTDQNPTYFEYFTYLTEYFALESYLNYLGETVYPETWMDEKSFFSTGEYRGTIGKLKWLSEKLNVPRVSDTSKRPGQTISNLRKIRSLLVHGSLDITEENDRIAFSNINFDTFLPNSIEKRIHDDFFNHSHLDIEEVISELHKAAKNYPENGRRFQLIPNALIGPVQIEIGDAKS